MFYSVEALLLSKDLSFSSHKAVIAAFGEHFVKSGIFRKELSKALIRAFEKRQISDYEYTFVITEKETKDLIKDAEVFLNSISEYLKGKDLV